MQRNSKSEARDEGKGVGGVDRQRRQQRENIVEEMVLDPGALGLGDIPAIDENDPDLG
jgi:hypothetical protein